MDEESDDVSYDLEYHQNEAIEKLSTIFRLLNIKSIQDKVAVRPIRAKIDEVYRYLHELCDVLEGQPQYQRNANPHNLLISESNELLDGLKRLFDESDDKEQTRLMTIAPQQWGRKQVEKCDGAAAHFKNNASILNLVHHRRDFNLDGCWTFTVTGH
ncbi:unnamed protein product, partial [Rotaria socialis]